MKTTLFESAESLDNLDDVNENYDLTESIIMLENLDLMYRGLENLEEIKESIELKSIPTKEDYISYLSAYDQYKNTFGIPDTTKLNISFESLTNPETTISHINEVHTNITMAMENIFITTLKTIGNNFVYYLSIIDDYEVRLLKTRRLIEEIPEKGKYNITFKATSQFSYNHGTVCSSIEDYKKQLRISTDSLKLLLNKFDKFISNHGLFSKLTALFSYLKDDVGETEFLTPYLDLYKETMAIVEVNNMRENGTSYMSENFLGEWYTAVLGYQGFKEANGIYFEKNDPKKEVNLKIRHIRSLLTRVNFFIGYDRSDVNRNEVVFKNVSKQDLLDVYFISKELGESLNDFKRMANKFRAFVNAYMQLQRYLTALSGVGVGVRMVLFRFLFARVGLVIKTGTLVNTTMGNLFHISKNTINGVVKIVNETHRESRR